MALSVVPYCAPSFFIKADNSSVSMVPLPSRSNKSKTDCNCSICNSDNQFVVKAKRTDSFGKATTGPHVCKRVHRIADIVRGTMSVLDNCRGRFRFQLVEPSETSSNAWVLTCGKGWHKKACCSACPCPILAWVCHCSTNQPAWFGFSER